MTAINALSLTEENPSTANWHRICKAILEMDAEDTAFYEMLKAIPLATEHWPNRFKTMPLGILEHLSNQTSRSPEIWKASRLMLRLHLVDTRLAERVVECWEDGCDLSFSYSSETFVNPYFQSENGFINIDYFENGDDEPDDEIYFVVMKITG